MIRPGLIQEFAIAIDWAWINGADVINCSWGDQSIFDGPYITDAVNRAVTQGRGGKGCVVVVSAGNEGVNAVSFPARLPNVIAVGAVDKNGLVCDYSNEGSELDVVAPSGKTGMKGDVYTTDIAGDDGYESPGDYTSSFGGTSAAAPQVSGIAALILSLNPDLEYDEVPGIITSTADRLIRNNQYGYGLVDAHKAVSQTLDMLYGHLVISGPDQPALNTTVTYTVPAPPSGLEFDSWTISPGNGYTVMGSTSTTLSIRFSTMNLYTITANYTLSNGSNYSVTKEKINLYPLPTITGPNSVRLNRAAAYKLSGSLPSGVTVQRWDLTPGTMLLWESALSDLRFDPLFYTVGLNTVSVTFDLPGGQTYTVTKGVNVTNGGVIPETPILEPFSDYSDQYGAEIENANRSPNVASNSRTMVVLPAPLGAEKMINFPPSTTTG